MKALIYITIFLMSGIWFTSCKTSRNIETQKQIDYSGDFLYLRNLIESLRLDVNKQTKITTDKLSDLKIENKTVYLSAPDSSGKQYHIKESTTTASKQDQEKMFITRTPLNFLRILPMIHLKHWIYKMTFNAHTQVEPYCIFI